MAVTPITQLGNQSLGSAMKSLSTIQYCGSAGSADKQLSVVQEKKSPSSNDGQASNPQDSNHKTTSSQSLGQLGKDKKTSSSVFPNDAQTSTSSTFTEPEDSVTRKLRGRQNDVTLNSDRTMTLDSGYI